MMAIKIQKSEEKSNDIATFPRKIDEPLRGSRIACPADLCKVARICH
jgi:hypothetical protein